MADHRATVEELTAQYSWAQARETEAQAAYARAVESRVRTGITLDLTRAREAGEL